MTSPARSEASGKRIAVVAPFRLDVRGGAATVLLALASAYRARGAAVTVVARAGGDLPWPSSLGESGRVMPQWRDVHTRGAGKWLRALASELGADAVHVHNFAGGLSAAAVGELARERRTVLTLHDHYALCHRGGMVRASGALCPGPGRRCLACTGRLGRRELHRPWRLQAIRGHLAPPLIVVSPSEHGSRLLQQHGYPQVFTVGNGVDLGVFRPPASPRAADGGAIELIAAGRASRVKGVRVAQQAAEALALRTGRPVRLRWVGPRAAATAASLGSPVFCGIDPVPHEELARLYGAADIALVPSLAAETFGLAAAEAMACGLPVVASDSGALAEVLGDAGVLVPPGDAGALATALADLVADPARRADLGTRAAARAREHFDWEPIADRYLELLVGGAPPGGDGDDD